MTKAATLRYMASCPMQLKEAFTSVYTFPLNAGPRMMQLKVLVQIPQCNKEKVSLLFRTNWTSNLIPY